MPKMNFSANVMNVFSEMGTDYQAMYNLMADVALGHEIFDEETQTKISKAKANEKILEFSRKVYGITDTKDTRALRRARREHDREWFDVIEEVVNLVVSTGIQENEWFNSFVERKTIGYGDRADFYTDVNDTLFSIAQVGESHHDHVLQRLRAGEVTTIPTKRYAAKLGADINRYITGDVLWSDWIQVLAKSFISKIQEEAYAALDSAVNKLPVTTGFVDNGALSAATKDAFDTIISNVSAANDGADVAIYGTRTALKKLHALADVDWASDAQKEAVTNTGLLGTYEGSDLILVPQRFKDRNMNTKVFSDRNLFLMPKLDNKPVKVIDEGDTFINEITERGEQNGRWDDLMTYEVQRRFGVGVVIGRYFGKWTLPA